MKKSRNKYQHMIDHVPRGELMLIHECVECKALSINRIAADDDAQALLSIFEESLTLGHHGHAACQEKGIVILNVNDTSMIRAQLYGEYASILALSWD